MTTPLSITAPRPGAPCPTTAPEILHNRANHETFIFDAPIGDAADSFRVVLGKGGTGGGNALVHLHPAADEIFEVVSGRLTVVVDGVERTVEPGQSVTVPRGAPHHFRNAHGGETECIIRFSPPQQQVRFFRNFARLADTRPDWFSAAGDARLLLIALALHAYRDHLYVAGIPTWLQKVIFALLAPLARWRGYQLAVAPLPERTGSTGPVRLRATPRA